MHGWVTTQAIDRRRETFGGDETGAGSRVDYEYVRHGVVNIFTATEPLTGKRYVQVTEYKTKKDWARFVKRIADEWYPKAEKIKLVMDNFKTHDP